MKYIKFKNMNKVLRRVDKLALSELPLDEQKIIKRKRNISNFLTIIAFVIFVLLNIFFIFVIQLIKEPEKLIPKLLYGILIFFLMIIELIVSGLIVGIPFEKILNKVNCPKLRYSKYNISKACDIIRKYYKLDDEYLITKCFYSTNQSFNDHDVCIFRVSDTIRITGDIVKGYLNDNSELGCYSVKTHEVKIYKDNYNNKRVAILEFGKEKFILGIKAFSFINKLLSIKVYKFLNKRIELDDDKICLVNDKNKDEIYYKDIIVIRFDIPKYDGLIGSGYDYTYNMCIATINKMSKLFIVLERSEEKEIIEFLKRKNVNLKLNYIDNKYEGGD